MRQARPVSEKKADVALGRRLAKFRKERGLTQVELAEKVGCKQSAISNYERGQLRPSPSMLVKFAKTLKVSSDEILGLSKPADRMPAVTRRLLRRLQAMEKLPKRDLDALLRTIDTVVAARNAS